MKLQGNYTFPVPPDCLWPLLKDPAVLTAVLPGCQKLEAVGENQYQGELIIPVGPLAGSYSGSLALSHVVQNEGFTFTFTAQSKTGIIGGNGRFQLQPQAANTFLTYKGEAKVGGQLTSYATPLLETNARSLIRQSLENLDHTIQYGRTSTLSPQTQTVTETAAHHILSTPQSILHSDQRNVILLFIILAAGILTLLFYFFIRKTRP
ncbi:MAG: carbon monoxide dehydrogenase subunit G [Chloroflexota bacterium]